MADYVSRGDGRNREPEHVESLLYVFRRRARRLDWRRVGRALLNNAIGAHGRDSFLGRRSLPAALR